MKTYRVKKTSGIFDTKFSGKILRNIKVKIQATKVLISTLNPENSYYDERLHRSLSEHIENLENHKKNVLKRMKNIHSLGRYAAYKFMDRKCMIAVFKNIARKHKRDLQRSFKTV